MISIDGSEGEGGGQIVRTALGLSLVTGRPFRIEKLRGKRSRPGLLRQHLAAVRAAAEIGGARVEGAELGSLNLEFHPGPVRPGPTHEKSYRFAVGSAGSAMLVLQAVLPALLVADGPTTLHLEGGTHNPWSPSFPFVEQAFLPLLRRMGARIEARLLRPGFYPAGGGALEVRVEPSGPLQPLSLLERGALLGHRAEAMVSALPRRIATDELRVLREGLGISERDRLRVVEVEQPRGPGNAVWVVVESEQITEVFTGFGRKGAHASTVAEEVLAEVRAYLGGAAPVGPHLADQLVIPLALAGAGCLRIGPPTEHTRTNVQTVRRFIERDLRLEATGSEGWELRVAG